MFLILKLYNAKTERDEEIKNDLLRLRTTETLPKPSAEVLEKVFDKRSSSSSVSSRVQPSGPRPSEGSHPLGEDPTEDDNFLSVDIQPSTQAIELNNEYFSSSDKRLFAEASKFFYFYSSKVEITREDAIQEVYFIKMPYSVYLEDADKDKFNIEVDRKTTLNKVKSLFGAVDYLGSVMKFGYFLNSSNFLFSILFKHEAAYTLISFLTACIVNILIVMSFATGDPKNQDLNMKSASLVSQVNQDDSS